MSAIRIAELFGEVGFKVDFTNLNRFQQRLSQAKAQLVSLRALSGQALVANTNTAAVRSLNSELQKTLALTKAIAANGGLKVRNVGPAGVGQGGLPGRGTRNKARGAARGASAGLFSGLGFGKASPLARNFLGGFTAALAVRSLFQAQVALDGIRVGIEAILKPGESLNETLTFLRTSADQLGFEFATSATEFAKLAAAGNAAGLSTKEVRDIFISAQEASRVFSLSVADTEGVLKAFTQIISKGKVTAEELRNQLGDRLPAAVPLAAKALGVTTQELGQMLEKGQILANDFLPKFAKVLHESFAGSIENASHTAQANLNRFFNAWLDFRAELVRSGIGEVFSMALEGAAEGMKILIPLVKALGAGVRALFTPIHALGRILRTFFKAIPNAVTWIGILTAAIALLAQTQLAAIAPWILGGAAIAAIIILIDDLATALRGGDSVLADMAATGEGFTAWLAQTLLDLGAFIQKFSEFVAALVTGFEPWEAFKALLQSIWDIALHLLETLGKIADSISGGALGKFGSAIGTGVADAVDFTKATARTVTDAAGTVKRGFTALFGGAQVQVIAPPGTSPDELAAAIQQKLDEHTDNQLREARAAFGDMQ